MIVSAGDKLSDVRWDVEQIDDRNSIFNILPSAEPSSHHISPLGWGAPRTGGRPCSSAVWTAPPEVSPGSPPTGWSGPEHQNGFLKLNQSSPTTLAVWDLSLWSPVYHPPTHPPRLFKRLCGMFSVYKSFLIINLHLQPARRNFKKSYFNKEWFIQRTLLKLHQKVNSFKLKWFVNIIGKDRIVLAPRVRGRLA